MVFNAYFLYDDTLALHIWLHRRITCATVLFFVNTYCCLYRAIILEKKSLASFLLVRKMSTSAIVFFFKIML